MLSNNVLDISGNVRSDVRNVLSHLILVVGIFNVVELHVFPRNDHIVLSQDAAFAVSAGASWTACSITAKAMAACRRVGTMCSVRAAVVGLFHSRGPSVLGLVEALVERCCPVEDGDGEENVEVAEHDADPSLFALEGGENDEVDGGGDESTATADEGAHGHCLQGHARGTLTVVKAGIGIELLERCKEESSKVDLFE
jgi:hypothetical protein